MSDEHMEGNTQSGADVVLYVEPEADCCYVSIESSLLGYVRFNFNPDFPQDAKQFYLALLEVRSIIQEDR